MNINALTLSINTHQNLFCPHPGSRPEPKTLSCCSTFFPDEKDPNRFRPAKKIARLPIISGCTPSPLSGIPWPIRGQKMATPDKPHHLHNHREKNTSETTTSSGRQHRPGNSTGPWLKIFHHSRSPGNAHLTG